jgi:serine/threonine protein kinase
LRLWKTFQDKLHLFVKMDCPENGDLWDRSRFYGVMGESVDKNYACQIIKVIHTIHKDYDIVHRYFKPENTLLTKDMRLSL